MQGDKSPQSPLSFVFTRHQLWRHSKVWGQNILEEQNSRKEEEMGDLSASKWNGFIRLKQRLARERERGRKGKWRRIRFAGRRIRNHRHFPIEPRCRPRGKYDGECDGPTMTELHMATIQAELRGDGFEMIWSEENESAPLCLCCTASDGSWRANGKVKSFNVFIIHCCLVRATPHLRPTALILQIYLLLRLIVESLINLCQTYWKINVLSIFSQINKKALN